MKSEENNSKNTKKQQEAAELEVQQLKNQKKAELEAVKDTFA